MPFQHSPPERQTRPQDRTQAVLTPTPRVPLDETPAEAPSRKEGRGPRRSSLFPCVFGAFPSISRITFRGPGEDDAEEEGNSVEEETSDSTQDSPTPVGHIKVLEDQLYPILISLSLIILNHLYWPLCNK
ncbi:hypothetical protein O181_008131 [Austropuccinia psidii MF-1]|uniref:Uncharacterized protein n=1 Tax=Austropuccinia psidii MF-1 TaxID=1389203 RepID=A0A9Q3GI88_9BASI|nr:hypothetical protein [Austropuccinia psidii MF-1]